MLETKAAVGGLGSRGHWLASVQQGRQPAQELSIRTQQDLHQSVPLPTVGLGAEVEAGWRGVQQSSQLSW